MTTKLKTALVLVAIASTAAMADAAERRFPEGRQQASPRRFSSSRATNRPSASSDQAIKWADDYLKQYDKNNNGRLDEGEVTASKFKKYDVNENGVVHKEELVAVQRSASSKSTGSRFATKANSSTRSYRLTNPIDKLPTGLPSWFRQKDANKDGQVAMHEYSTRWTDSTARRFLGLDKNDDGLITPDEARSKR